MRKMSYIFIIAVFFLFSFGLLCQPALVEAANESYSNTNESDIYLMIQSFTWTEFMGGSQLLEESGTRYGVGFSSKSVMANAATTKFKIEMFTGSVDYDGQTQAGSPLKTETDYLGIKLEGDFGKKIMQSEMSSFEPFAGLGFKWWSRELQGTGGYEEIWTSLYGRLGIRGDRTFSGQTKLFGEIGISIPFYNRNEVDLSAYGLGEFTLEPKSQAGGFAEIGFKLDRAKISVFYEGMRFAESDPDSTGTLIQPESEEDIFGINFGAAF